MKRLLLVLALLLCSGLAGARPPRDDEGQTRLGRLGGIVPAANIITITDKGTSACFDDVVPQSVCLKTNVTITNGARIVVLVVSASSMGAVAAITWGADVFPAGPAYDRTETGTFNQATLASLPNATGGTRTITVTMTTPQSSAGILVAVAQVTGTNGVDLTNGASGADPNPTVTFSGATNHANEILVAGIGADNGALGGVWGNSFTGLSNTDDSGAGGTDGLSLGYRLVSSIGSYGANKSGTSAIDWAMVAVGYYQ